MDVVSYPQREWGEDEERTNALGTGQTSAHAELSVIDALRRGDEGAFARLVDQYHASLRRVARLYIANRAVADEVVQDTWLGVIQGIWAFEGRSSLKTWIFRILINRAKTRAAREGRTVPFARFDADVEAAEAAVAPDRFQPVDHPTEPGHWTHPPPDLGSLSGALAPGPGGTPAPPERHRGVARAPAAGADSA